MLYYINRTEEGNNLTKNRTLSRTTRHQKRRNNKRKLLFFSLLGIVFIIVLFSLIVFGNKDHNKSDLTIENQEETAEKPLNNDEDDEENEDDSEDIDEDYDLESDIDVQEVDSTDDNVIVAYTGNWDPIGTSQTGTNHSTDYSDGSADRVEIKRAVSAVTGISEDDMTEHWVGNDGEQKVVATVSSKSVEEIYRVYLSWIDNEGWQVTKVERIKNPEKQ